MQEAVKGFNTRMKFLQETLESVKTKPVGEGLICVLCQKKLGEYDTVMNKTFKLAISAVLGAAMVTPAFAQRDNFPDVKDTHWASEAVNRLKKEGIITGYPDGTFKGKQNITRYELATILYAIYTNLKNVTDGLDANIRALDAKVNAMSSNTGNGGGGSVVDNSSELRQAISSLRSEVSSMKAWGTDISNMKKMADSYQKELTSMGVDVEAMKKSLGDLTKRVEALENKKSTITFSGDANFFVTAASKGSRGNAPINQDGRWQSSNTQAAGLDTLRVQHELGINIDAGDVHGTIVASNFFGAGSGFLNQSTVNNQYGRGYNEGNTNVYINELYARVEDSLGGRSFSAKIGRQGLKISPFVMQRLDVNSFYDNSREDNGEFMVDGVNASLKLGGDSSLGLFLGRTSSQVGTSGGAIQPITIGAEQLLPANVQLPIQRTMGATLNFGFGGSNGNLLGSYVQFDGDQQNVALANRLEVTGLDLNYKLGGNLHLMGGWGKSLWKDGSASVLDNDNMRTNAGLNYNGGALSLGVSYSNVEAQYLAPGDWGRTGIFRNLTNLRTTAGNLGYKMNDRFDLFGSVSRGEAITGTGKVDGFTAGFNYKINGAWDLTTTYENTEFKNGFGGLGNPSFKFTTFAFKYNMAQNTMFKLMYQLTDVTNIANPPGGPLAANNPNGGFLAAQFSVKF
jgi:hypothetical protein